MGEFFVAYDPESGSEHFSPKMQNIITQSIDVPNLGHDVLHRVPFGFVPLFGVRNSIDELHGSIDPNAGKYRLCSWTWDASKMPHRGLQCCFEPGKYGYEPTK